MLVVGRNFWTSYITVIVCNSLLWMFFVLFFIVVVSTILNGE